MKNERLEIALLGLVADHRRTIKPGFEYDKYFPKASGTETMITRDGTVQDTIKAMDKMVNDTLSDTAKIAPLLKGKTLVETCDNVWNFIYTHVQYKLDRDGVEELRRPRRTWSMDRTTGVDCDCMSLFAGSILTNLGISFKFRVTKYAAGWQHVYVIVPLPEDSRKYYVIDCVLNSFNEEKPYSGKFDHTMKTATLSGIPIAMLGSLGEATVQHSNELEAILNGDHFDIDENVLEGLGDVEDIEKTMLDKFLDHLKATREYIAKNPDGLTIVGGAKTHLEMIDYAIDHWNTPQRDAALDALAKEEDRWNAVTAPLNGVDDSASEDSEDILYIDGIGEIGKLKINIKAPGKKLFTAIKEGVKSVKVVAKKVAETAKTNVKKAATVVKAAVKKVGKFLVKYNPLTLMMRAGVLAAMHVNLFGMAERLLPGLLTQSEAAAKGVPVDLWNKSKAGFEKVAQVFEKIGGSRAKLIQHIKTGRASKKASLAGLGEPVTTAVTVTAAAATLLTAMAKMKEAGVSESQYKASSAASKKPLKGIGEAADVAVPETEMVDTDSSGNVVEDKKGLAKFVDAIKKWFGKNKQADVNTTAIVEGEQQAATPGDGTGEGGGEEATGEEGFFAQVGNFVKNNPGTTAAIGFGVATIAAFAFSPKLRAKVGFGPKKKTASSALSGPGKKKKAKAKKSLAKRIEL